ncbi:MAG TPA: hypothetical protein PLB55_05890 [Prosthecobacter sp.]|nr:hypothetical protein [Prosthecobacter sp.]
MNTDSFPPAMPHGAIEELFPEVFFVTGTMRAELMGSHWQFSRNMIVVREGRDLTLVNTVRLDDQGLAALDELGTVKNVLRIGDLHGHDDAFYVARSSADYWGLPGMMVKNGVAPDKFLTQNGRLPVGNCSLFTFQTTKRPECILRLDRDGGIMLACDALQNWETSDQYFDPPSETLMTDMGFFQKANCGVLWMNVNEPKPEDFNRLKEIPFENALCGHGQPLQGAADAFYAASFNRLFGV